ncbi:sarcosine oxidase subunit gamma family protein [Paraburkholderia sp. BL10I2N1]|uniref:sarcosine oxidase subunit gamma n=1 Tax=Paraburkholderia sp. BL10I2N1 TaxID=1938796 RepID=UPI00105C65BF|nr:sarcosine oxidase subunit gamma family protein [Paraburkholderia sp. BL10I2N1]TDN63079.1 sarcosine oxidase subunit gamma [Paraburkholderia sp. BL10I2N1]
MAKLEAAIYVTRRLAPSERFPVRGPTLCIDEQPLGGIVRLQGDAGDAGFAEAVSEATGLALPAPERFAARGDTCLAWSGPTEWLYFCSLDDEQARLRALQAACDGRFATATLISDSRTGFLVSGADSASLLAKGCAIDFSAAACPIGRVVTTRFAGLPTMLLHRGNHEYLVYVDVSYAAFLLHWLLDAVSEFAAVPA